MARSDTVTIRFGAGLPMAELEWLYNVIKYISVAKS